ncbi:hypothetical protein CK203_096074 [Vitis vinifera]|uniref:Uncharacterized protein n=1 Tax=Vitis vinifera TaxID=29760 RepID=A0A438CGX6_VITVI|nr:hypothetical protein CK203_096074 [Vitis vinifera]
MRRLMTRCHFRHHHLLRQYQQASPYLLHSHSEITPPAVVHTTVIDDAHARMDRIEQCMRQLRVSNGSAIWDDLEGMLVPSLSAKFRMPNIEKYTGIGCPQHPSSTLHHRDEGPRIGRVTDDYLIPLSLSGGKRLVDYRPRAPSRSYDQAYMPPILALPYHAAQDIERPPVSYSATGQPCYAAYQALRKLTKAILLTILTPRPLPQPVRLSLGWIYTMRIIKAKCNTNPLPSHTTHAVPPPADSMHSIDFAELDDQIHMMSWNESKLEPIVSDEIYEISRVTLGSRIPTPFRLVLEAASVQTTTVVPLTVSYYSAQTSFVLIPDVEEVLTPYVDDVHIPDIQYVIRGGRVVRQQPLTTARPLEGTSSHEEARREDDEILRHPEPDRNQDYITPKRLIHMVTAGRATCIVFSNDDVPPEGSDHTPPLYIFVGCSGRRIPYVLLDNGSTLNVYPLATAIAIGYVPSDFSPPFT